MRKSSKAATTSFWVRVLQEQVERERAEREEAELELRGDDTE
jgi:hypothetical protein